MKLPETRTEKETKAKIEDAFKIVKEAEQEMDSLKTTLAYIRENRQQIRMMELIGDIITYSKHSVADSSLIKFNLERINQDALELRALITDSEQAD